MQISRANIPVYPISVHDIFQRILTQDYGPFDAAGLPLVDYDRLFARNHIKHAGKIGTHYTPVTLAFFALGNFAQCNFHKLDLFERRFREVAEWFLQHQVEARNTGGVWLHRFPMPHLPVLLEYVPGAWISAMAQGLAVSVLVRAYHAFNERQFLESARHALQPFQYSIFDGGVAYALPNDQLFLEEFPANPPMHVLNGALFAALGLAEYLQIIDDEALSRVYQKVLAGIRTLLPRFETGYGSLYDLRRRQIANAGYHDLHVQLLRALGKLADEKEFLATSQRWRTYRQSRVKRSCHWLAERAWAVRRRMQFNPARKSS